MASPQRFTISHYNEADFKTGGLRDYSSYRDLGVAEAPGGLAQAHVIRMIAPFRPDLSVRHHHDVQFQMVYCLKGWFETEFEGVGRQRLIAGSSWVQPPGIRHTVVGWSEDCELLEIYLPAHHATINDPGEDFGYHGANDLHH
jgi:cupin domain